MSRGLILRPARPEDAPGIGEIFLAARRGALPDLADAQTLSPGRLELSTFARNEGARRFYERHGFRPIAFGQDNEENEPDVLYEWVSP